MAKPFIAARVPQKIEDKLNEHVQETGLGKTEIIVNALAEYLGCSIDVPEETRAVDRLIAVEKELAELQKRVGVLEKPIEKAPDSKIPGQQVLSFESPRVDSKIDNQTENIETKAEIIEEVTDINSDNEPLTNRQISELTGFKLETVRTWHKKSTPIEWEGKRFIPVKDGERHKWQLANSALSISDN